MLPTIAIVLSCLTLLYTVGKDVFGGGNKLAGMFHKLDKDTSTAMSLLHDKLTSRVDTHEDNVRIGIDAIKANNHEIREGMLRLRAETSEALHSYMRKDDFQALNAELKRDMKEGFDRIERRLERIEHPGDGHG